MSSLADHADHEGKSIFPSVALIEWKTGYKRRQVQRILRDLRDMGVLVVVKKAGQHRPTEYKFNWKKAKKKAPFRGVIDAPDASLVASSSVIDDARGVIVKTPEPSLKPPINEPIYEDIDPKPKRMPKKKQDPLVKAIADVTDTDLKGNYSWLSKQAKALWEGDYTPEDVYSVFGEDGSWYKDDWRGKKGQKPGPVDIPRNIKKYMRTVQEEYVHPSEKDTRDIDKMLEDHDPDWHKENEDG